MKLLEKAREIATARNLDINKQEILLLMRMNKQAKAADKLKEYLDLLAEYKQQNDMNTYNPNGSEKNWTGLAKCFQKSVCYSCYLKMP